MLKKLRNKLHLPLPLRITSHLLHQPPTGGTALALELAHVVFVSLALFFFRVYAGGGEGGCGGGDNRGEDAEGSGGGDKGGGGGERLRGGRVGG